jgi:hypothetical protein
MKPEYDTRKDDDDVVVAKSRNDVVSFVYLDVCFVAAIRCSMECYAYYYTDIKKLMHHSFSPLHQPL